MPHVLKLANVIVGRCDLAIGESRSARAPFRPGVGWELVEPIFELGRRADAEGIAQYRRARDTLALALYDDDGTLVETTRIDIEPDGGSPTGLAIAVHVVRR